MSPDIKPELITSQPKGVVMMNLKEGGNKNALNRAIGEDGMRDWSFGIFDCLPRCRLCLLATFCPCVVYGQNRQRLRHLKDRGVPLPGGGDRVNQDCRAHCCMLPCFYWVFEMGVRSDIRRRYNIRGEELKDCCHSLYCHGCALTQERRELELEEASFS
ncbi:PLAC8 family-domain-containing protein [Russula vinacea]|nr:PLAC8 family-domain-containing protein [Russula vinacea]